MLRRTFTVASMLVLLINCGQERRRGPAVIRTARDAGAVATDGGGADAAVRDAGPDLCAANPNNCVPRQLKGAAPGCDCLAACQSGWMWNGIECIEAVGRDAGVTPRDGGVTPRDGGVTPRDGGVVASDPFAPTQAARTYAQAFCQHRTRCEPALYSFLLENEGNCVADLTRDETVIYNLYANMIAANRLSFSQAAFNTCIASFGTSDCVSGVRPACDTMFTGSQPVGQACAYSEECAGDGWCGTTQLGACGACVAAAQNGADCSNSVCASGLICATAGAQMICVPGTATEGQTCGDINTGLCVGRLQCVGAAGATTCRRPAGNGATCDAAQTTSPACDIFFSSTCVNTTCAAANWVGGGQTCTPPNACNSTAACNQTTTMCVAHPQTGQTCMMTCADGLYCNAQSVCAAQGGQGATCTAGAECQPGQWCVNQTCGPLTYPTCP